MSTLMPTEQPLNSEGDERPALPAATTESSEHAAAGRSVPRWLLEGAVIFISVVLSFAVTQFGERRADREHVGRTLAGIETERKENLATLEPFAPLHRRWLKALQEADRSRAGSPGSTASLVFVHRSRRPPLYPRRCAEES